MKKTKQIIALLLCLVMVVAGTVFATVAYLTSRASVLNTFTVGKVEIVLEETEVNGEGQPTSDPAVTTTEGNKYHLIPGQTYVKDPTVTIDAESEACYVRMLVTLNRLSVLKSVFGDDFLPQNYVQGWDNTTWVPVSAVDNGNNTITYEFRYFDGTDYIVETDGTNDLKLDALMDSFKLPETVKGSELAQLNDPADPFVIKVDAHAIQASTFAGADAAWLAFDAQNGD